MIESNAEGIAGSKGLLNRHQLDQMLQKARLEGAIGYITHLCDALDEGKIKALREIDQTVRVTGVLHVVLLGF